MASNINDGLSVEAISLNDEVLLTSGTNDPSSDGFPAPLSSLYFRTNGSIYQKTLVSDTGWVLLGSGLSSAHNLLTGIQGGTTNEFYHLTSAQHTSVISHLTNTNNPHSTLISQLGDVLVSSPINRQFFIYDTTSTKWKNQNPTTNDLTISTNRNFVTDSQLVVINNTSGVNSGDQTDVTLSFSDVTNNNVSNTRHGFVPKAPGTASTFLNGLSGTWTTPQISSIDGVSITSPANSQALVFNGSVWANTLIAVPPAGSGRLVQVKYGAIPGATGTTSFTAFPTAPTSAGGTQIWSDTISPTFSTSDVRISSSILVLASNTNTDVTIAVFRGTTLVGATTVRPTGAGKPASFVFYDSPATTSAVTYSCRVGRSNGAATWYVNRTITNTGLTWLEENSYTLEEIGK